MRIQEGGGRGESRTKKGRRWKREKEVSSEKDGRREKMERRRKIEERSGEKWREDENSTERSLHYSCQLVPFQSLPLEVYDECVG